MPIHGGSKKVVIEGAVIFKVIIESPLLDFLVTPFWGMPKKVLVFGSDTV